MREMKEKAGETYFGSLTWLACESWAGRLSAEGPADWRSDRQEKAFDQRQTRGIAAAVLQQTRAQRARTVRIMLQTKIPDARHSPNYFHYLPTPTHNGTRKTTNACILKMKATLQKRWCVLAALAFLTLLKTRSKTNWRHV